VAGKSSQRGRKKALKHPGLNLVLSEIAPDIEFLKQLSMLYVRDLNLGHFRLLYAVRQKVMGYLLDVSSQLCQAPSLIGGTNWAIPLYPGLTFFEIKREVEHKIRGGRGRVRLVYSFSHRSAAIVLSSKRVNISLIERVYRAYCSLFGHWEDLPIRAIDIAYKMARGWGYHDHWVLIFQYGIPIAPKGFWREVGREVRDFWDKEKSKFFRLPDEVKQVKLSLVNSNNLEEIIRARFKRWWLSPFIWQRSPLRRKKRGDFKRR
jgi:hypothetical protein